MSFEELDHSIGLNKSRISSIGYLSKISYRHENSKLHLDILGQIATNLSVVITRYDQLKIAELLPVLRKNCIKGFELEFYRSSNTDRIVGFLEKNKRPEVKSKLLYIHNQLWLYINSNRKN